jgi:hypothetical protein
MNADFFHRLRPYATEQLAVAGTAVSFSTAKVDNTANYPDFKAAGAICEVRTDAIYYTVDGTTPSSTNGIKADAGDEFHLAGYQKVKNFKAIQVTAGATVNVQFFKH